jgi:hypothetical protein
MKGRVPAVRRRGQIFGDRSEPAGLGVGLGALATATGSLSLLLAALDAGLEVVAAALEFAQNALGSKLPLEVLDGALDPLVANNDLEGLTLNGFGRHRSS